ncbi:hypothetical protein GCM10010269_22730 [Streptomyces humidus]|uniref:Uncharacterized protein n=1 Tax=Streptomyces humidus TaxID=52259 RepID=A0A918FTP3_9ACTN|nr:hypothetical protein GCM10010269_22730 [Streptomyces humidus]
MRRAACGVGDVRVGNVRRADRKVPRQACGETPTAVCSVPVVRMLVDADRAGMRAIAELVEAGLPPTTIAGAFPPAEAAEAHSLGDTGRTGRHRPDHRKAGPHDQVTRVQKTSTGLMVLPSVMSRTARSMSANG